MRAELKRAADLVAFQRREALSRKRLSGDPRNSFRPRYGAELTFAAASQEAETLDALTRKGAGTMKMRKQRLMGLAMLAITAFILVMARGGKTPEDSDATAALLTGPLGLYIHEGDHL